ERVARIVAIVKAMPSGFPPPSDTLDDDDGAEPLPLLRTPSLPDYDLQLSTPEERSSLPARQNVAPAVSHHTHASTPPSAHDPLVPGAAPHRLAPVGATRVAAEPRETTRRRGGALWLAVVVVAVAGGSVAYLRRRAGEWPFAAHAEPSPKPLVAEVPPPPKA